MSDDTQDPTHSFTVTVSGCSLAQAEQVLAERLLHDEDYGFAYTVDYQSKGDRS